MTRNAMNLIGGRQLRRLGSGLLSGGLLSSGLLISGLLSVGVMGLGWVGALPVAANERLEPIQLSNGAAAVRGVTAGERSLASMAGRDRRRKVCLGYAAAAPNHRLTLTEPQPRLRINVDSDGQDTTLLVLGPRGIDCNDNYTREHRDAAITARDWPAGEYQIWVGSFEAGDRIDYQLRIENPQ